MSANKSWITKLLIAAVVVAFCGGPELAQGQAPSNPPVQQQPGTSTSDTNTQQDSTSQDQPQTATPPATNDADEAATDNTAQQQPARPNVVDPAAGPLQPVPSQPLPDAPSSAPAQQQQQQRQRVQQPAGIGAAPAAQTTGGAASKPAGNAIAPAKQGQRRALILKLGLIGGAAVALGTVFALSKGTKSIPPGAVR